MKAKALLIGAMFGPDQLKIIGDAFDQAWADVDDAFSTPLAKEAARLYLANITLALASDESRDCDALRIDALKALALKYPQVIDPLGHAKHA